MSDKQAVDAAMKGIDIVYHLAAAMSGDWTQHLDTTVRGTKNVLDAMVKNDVKKLVYVSSVSVYDHTNYPNNGIIDEEFPYEKNPYKRGCYTNAKLKAEKLVRKYMEDGRINACIIRPGMVYGPGRPPFRLGSGTAQQSCAGSAIRHGAGPDGWPGIDVDVSGFHAVSIFPAGYRFHSHFYGLWARVAQDHKTDGGDNEQYNGPFDKLS